MKIIFSQLSQDSNINSSLSIFLLENTNPNVSKQLGDPSATLLLTLADFPLVQQTPVSGNEELLKESSANELAEGKSHSRGSRLVDPDMHG